jgi:alkylation response protein AidB-like acyl-CoA dehydrogenase
LRDNRYLIIYRRRHAGLPIGRAEGQVIGARTALPEHEQAIVALVRSFVDAEVLPVVDELEHADAYPAELIEGMKGLGVYGLCVPPPYGEVQVSTACFARVTEELARGWMSLAGAMGGHSVVAQLLAEHGTAEQKERYLPRLATGELRATMALTEPDGGSDLQALRTTATRKGDAYVVDGAKTWISNGARAGLVALLCKTDVAADPPHRGISILLLEPADGYEVSKPLQKLGYKGVEAVELSFDGCRVPADRLLGGAEGRGFPQMMRGLEVGRIQVACRALGVARAAFEDSLAYAQQREAFGQPIWQHQAIGHYLADMATKLEAARGLVLAAAERFDAGERADLEAGMAKLFASEVCLEITQLAVRIHGGHGYSKEYRVERYFRDAPLMVVGEGTNEIQRNVIVRELVRRGGIA